ncbi:single-stranded DNA-binding protein [Streptococcus agalactiae]|uniref:single-stranded DNA-binding protein n=1 Tax=Streptococcus agalactiae TaxID=1311 RepID=UPI000F5DC98E|nr:single-stranded DNA-binding protein [Streptococcus agalactiae]RRA59950.1 single-stranded DNA-binding protein [Streptococcus agalactiae]RRB09764.1 single-stranded DNA-binding protein [Streptococcus agalactiae]
MQTFIANGRVADVPDDAVGQTAKGKVSFTFTFVCDSSLTDDQGKPIASFFTVKVYGKQAEIMAQSLVKGSPVLVKGEIIQRSYTNKEGQRRNYQYISPSQHDGIVFLESKEAANQRKLRQLNGTPSMENIDPYPQPMDVGEPF